MDREVSKEFTQIKRHLKQVDKRLEQVDKRFEQVDKRFEQVDKRFEQIDKRFDSLVTRVEFEATIQLLLDTMVTKDEFNRWVTIIDRMAKQVDEMYVANTLAQSQFVDTQDQVAQHEQRISKLEVQVR